MSSGRKVAISVVIILLLGGIVVFVHLMPRHEASVLLKGAVFRRDSDPNKELPIAGVEITAADGLMSSDSRSDSSGFFSVSLPPEVRPGQSIILHFAHPDYQPLDMQELVGDKLYVASMVPVLHETQAQLNRPEVVVANISVRYSIKTTTAMNVGSAVKTFTVVNTGNVPCNGKEPCSPDGKWKAALGSTSLDAGEGNEYRNTRVSCIAGPCPFTKIESDGLTRRGRSIHVSVRNWSDTATFLLEAEVFRPMVSDMVRKSYPVIFGQALNFTLPAAAEGVSIIAEMNGETIVFPLGPNLFLSWANCDARVNNDQTKVYRCELKPGYRFHD